MVYIYKLWDILPIPEVLFLYIRSVNLDIIVAPRGQDVEYHSIMSYVTFLKKQDIITIKV